MDGAEVRFTLGSTSGLPSGLLRLTQRVGEANLINGHADVAMKLPPKEPDPEIDRTSIDLTATLPYADLKMKFGKKAAIVSVFGKLAKVAGVPPFLDEALAPARAILAKAAKGEADLHKACGLRVMADALNLMLLGKSKVNDLRRLYTLGLSPDVAKEIMFNMDLALKEQTRKIRMIVAGSVLAACTLVFALLFISSLFNQMTAGLNIKVVRLILMFLPALLMGGAWFGLRYAIAETLKARFPKAKISQAQNIGRLGYGLLGGILLIYLIILLITGHLI